jgi:hypothetical protein
MKMLFTGLVLIASLTSFASTHVGKDAEGNECEVIITEMGEDHLIELVTKEGNTKIIASNLLYSTSSTLNFSSEKIIRESPTTVKTSIRGKISFKHGTPVVFSLKKDELKKEYYTQVTQGFNLKDIVTSELKVTAAMLGIPASIDKVIKSEVVCKLK